MYKDPNRKREYHHKYYLEHSDIFKKRARINNRRYRRDRQEEINHLKSQPCSDCGGIFPSECMDFDHVRGDKNANVSRLSNNLWSEHKVKREIDKCDIVCSNCHRIRTKARLAQMAEAADLRSAK